MTRAPVHMEPMLSISTSFLLSFVTLPCFSPLCNAQTASQHPSVQVGTNGSHALSTSILSNY